MSLPGERGHGWDINSELAKMCRIGETLPALVVVVLVGCGGQGADRRDGGRGFATRVDSNKALGMLSDAERTQLCDDVVTYTTATLVPDVCRRAALTITASMAQADSGLSDADLQSACASQYGACLASSGGSDAGAPASDAASMSGVHCDLSTLQPTCSATVADYAACLTDIDAADSGLPSCEAIARATLIDLASDAGLVAARPPSCSVVDQCSSGDAGR